MKQWLADRPNPVGYALAFASSDQYAEVPVSTETIEWADIIFVM